MFGKLQPLSTGVSSVLVLALGMSTLGRLVGQELRIKDPVRYLALGDSYTIGERVPEFQRWPNQLRDSLVRRGLTVQETRIIATTGWTTGNLLSAISNQDLRQEGYNLVSLLIGVNNQYQNRPLDTYRKEFQQLLDSALVYTRGDPTGVFVLSIPDYAYTPFGNGDPNISREIDAFNEVNDSITAAYGIRYFNITPISRRGLDEPGLVAIDGLHPSGMQYTLWVEEVLAYLDGLITSTASIRDIKPLRLYPVPAGEFLNVSGLDQWGVDQVQLLSPVGRVVRKESVEGRNSIRLDTKSLPAGLYLVRGLNKRGKVVVAGKFTKP